MARGLNGSSNGSGGHIPTGREAVEARLPGVSNLAPAVAAALPAVVGVKTTIPLDRRSAQSLGSEREGHGILIGDDGLIVTIGYLIMEADTVTITDIDGIETSAYIVGYDYESGFGLVRTESPLDVTPMVFGLTPPRPWLGIYTVEHMGQLVIGGISDGGPGDRAGLQRGDILHALNGEVLDDVGDFYRALWASGPAGTAVTLRMERDNDAFEVAVRTGDRASYHKYGSD